MQHIAHSLNQMPLFQVIDKKRLAQKAWYDHLSSLIPDYCLELLPWEEYSENIANHIGEPDRQSAIDRVCNAYISAGIAENKTEAKKLFYLKKVED